MARELVGKHDFEKGDRVRLREGKYYFLEGRELDLEKRIGDATGIITYVGGGDTLDVKWVGVDVLGNESETWSIDYVSLAYAGPTDEELAEVYEILGVPRE